jgi:hypothetical protein
MTAMRKAAMVAVTMFLLAAGRPADAATPEAAVGEAFVAARSALMAQNGEAVIDLLSHDTRRRVERMRTAALGGAMGGLSPSEKFGALGLQRFLKPAELKKMDAAQLVEYGLRKGWLGPNLIAGSGLDKGLDPRRPRNRHPDGQSEARPAAGRIRPGGWPMAFRPVARPGILRRPDARHCDGDQTQRGRGRPGYTGAGDQWRRPPAPNPLTAVSPARSAFRHRLR